MVDELTRRSFLGTAAGGAVMAGIGVAAQRQNEASAAPSRPAIIDAHVHLKHGDAARTEYSAQVIVQTMDAVGIDRSVVFAMSTTTRRSIEMAAEAVRQYPQRLIPYVYALPHYERPVIDEIDSVLKAGLFRGIKIHAGECTLAEYVIDPVLKLAAKHGAPCLVDCVGKYDAAKRMALASPETKLIIAHLGKYLATDAGLIDQFIRLAEKCRNVLLDVSGVVLVEKIATAVRQIGSSRLIWGTDGPHEKPDTVTFARTELEKIQKLSLSDVDKQNILGGTIRGLLAC